MVKLYDGEGSVPVKKYIWPIIYKFLKMGLFSYALLLFLLSGFAGSITATHATTSSRFPTLFPALSNASTPIATPSPTSTPTPTPSPTSTPTPTPTPSPTSTPSPTATATPMPTATPAPRVQPKPRGITFPVQTMATATPATATPASTPVSATPTAIVATLDKAMSTKTTFTNQQDQSAEDGYNGINTFVLPLSIGGPLLLASGGMFWLFRRRQMSHYKPALQGVSRNAQTSLWTSSREIDPDLNTLHYITGASGALPIPTTPQTSYMPVPTSEQLFTQPIYTLSGLPSINTAFPEQMFAISSNEAASYPQEDDLLPLSIDSLNLPFELAEARESTNSGQMPPLAASPIASTDIPISFTPFPPLAPPVISLTTQPPAIKNDPLLGEVMRQAQTGLFVVLGREKSLTNLHANH